MTRGEVRDLLERAGGAIERANRAHETIVAIAVELAAALRVTTNLVDELARELHTLRQEKQTEISRVRPREPR